MDRLLVNERKVSWVKDRALAAVQQVKDSKELEGIRQKYLGKKGELRDLIKTLPQIPRDKRPEIGRLINAVKVKIENAIKDRSSQLSVISYRLDQEWFDITIPGKKPQIGHLNPVTKILWELTEAFEKMGYQIIEGPEIETDWYNFEALNIPSHHPSRDLQDTFWLKNGMLPRTHTSAMQVRVMEKLKPPFKVAVPGWVYRCEREDATHESVFHHYEGFAVGESISFSDLKGTLYTLLQGVLGPKTELKFRASYFPYVEPCAEISATCPRCKGKGCPTCGNSGWLEILGSGMIHPVVLKNAKIDPKKYSGFAFCFGPTRLAMIKYQINDIRLFKSGDLRFLNQF